MKRIYPLAFLSMTALGAWAQDGHFNCAHEDPRIMQEMHGNDPAILESIERSRTALEEHTEAYARARTNGLRDGVPEGPLVIPVVFHIIHENGPENISDAQVHDAMRILNEDFNRLNPDWNNTVDPFLGIVANVGINFRLASLDPQGNCTSGINRVRSPLTYEGDREMKALSIWPRNRYLNVWISVDAGGAAGYSMYPSSVDGAWGEGVDGVVLTYPYIGSIGTGSPRLSRALTHEVGHWLNLAHPWGNSNEPGLASNCSIDDGVADTPNTVGWITCNVAGATCDGTLDNVQNFMEYSYCSTMFTEGQKARMRAALSSSVAQRSNLTTEANRRLTGTWTDQAPTLCAVNFVALGNVHCVNDPVRYEDRSFSNVSEWNWTFPGGTPATSTEQNPEVVYEAPGTYAATLTVGDGTRTITRTIEQVVSIGPRTHPDWLSESFENGLSAEHWTVIDEQGNGGFTLSSAAAATGSRSLRLNNLANRAVSRDDVLVSRPVDLRNANGSATLSFKYAFARTSNSNADRLSVHLSKDCGQTWVIRAQINASVDLYTSNNTGAPFVPLTANQWRTRTITNIPADFLTEDVRVRFTFTSGGGNDFWIDDINFGGLGVGIEEADQRLAELLVAPNPVADEAFLTGALNVAGRVTVEVLDATGRAVALEDHGVRPAGIIREQLPVAGLAPGLYMVRVRQGDATRTLRLVRQ